MSRSVSSEPHINRALQEIKKIKKILPSVRRGVLFHRLLGAFNSDDASRMLETAFACEWQDLNTSKRSLDNLLGNLLLPHEEHDRNPLLPKSMREEMLAELVAATVIQWLGTPIGAAFIERAYKKAGGDISYTLPITKEQNIREEF